MSKSIGDTLRAYVKKYWYVVALLLIIAVALWYREGIIDNYVIPTYGNTMYHVGVERLVVDTQHYPTQEISYGGGFPNFYVPAYRLLIASMSIVTGIDVMVMSGLMTIFLSVMIILVMYLVAYKLTNNLYIALFAAFFFVMSPELTIYTIRPLPEVLGLFLVPLTLYFVIQEKWFFAALGAIVTALTHQMTLLVLFSVIVLYAILQLIRAGWLYRKNKEQREVFMKPLRTALWCLAPALIACVAYGIWLMYSMGTIDFLGIAQVVNHEGNTVDPALFLRMGIFVLIFCIIGLVFIGYTLLKPKRSPAPEASPQDASKAIKKNEYLPNISVDSALLIVAWSVSTLLLAFNDRIFYYFPNHAFLIFPNFMDRYFTFFVQIVVIIAGYGMYALLSALDLDVLREKPWP